ncbi:MAG: hypothetical protein WDW36_003987 [Sanguina aurantia]
MCILHLQPSAETNAQRHLTDPADIAAKVGEAHDAADFLKESVVQARRSPADGSYAVSPDQALRLRQLAPEIIDQSS